jgi:chaperonin GroES
MINFIPIRDRILVKKIEDELKTKSGLQLSDDTKERPTKGEVLAVGAGKLNDDGKLLPMVVKTGDTILYPKYAGHPIKLQFEEYLILDENEVLGILIKGEKTNG